jgi:prolyl oligopeptidase
MTALNGALSRAATAALAVACIALPAFAGRIAYPPAPMHEAAGTLHGQVLVEAYRWLEEGESPAVREWTDAENALTPKALDGFAGRKALDERLIALDAVPVFSRPQLHGGRLFYSKRSSGQNQPVVMTRMAREGSPPRAILDPNTRSADGTVALDWIDPSPGGAWMAYGLSPNGSEQSTLQVRRVDDGQDLADVIPNTAHASLAWDRDGKGFHYTRHPKKGEVPDGEEVPRGVHR